QAKASRLGLTQLEVMQNLVAALNSSIQFNKRNFWIDPDVHNQYYVGVQYPEEEIQSIDTIENVPITSPKQAEPIPLKNVASGERAGLLPDGGAVQVVADAAGDPVGGAGRPGRRRADAVPYQNGDQRAVAPGRDLHGRYRRVQHGAAGRLRAAPAAARAADPD